MESVCRPQYLLDSLVYKTRFPLKRRRLEGDWYSLVSFFQGNYSHWLWEEMPRFFNTLPHLPDSTRFLVPPSLNEVQRHSLVALGVSQDRLLVQPSNVHSECERLWFATALGNQDWCVNAPDVVQKMRAPFVNTYGQPGKAGPERIFVSRGGLERNKRLLNEEELLPTIKKFGFAIVKPELLTFEQQICAFQNARIILGAHGAGLVNTFFSPPSSLLLELQDSVFAPRYWYWKMASNLGHEWRCCVGKSGMRPGERWKEFKSSMVESKPF
jgi:capsular polysaccharide biosynthesis protein